MNSLKKPLELTVFFFFLISSIVLSKVIFNNSFAEQMENGAYVKGNSTLTYYLNVNYDGVDASGVVSNDEVTSEVRSGNIYVTDKLPDGLEFKGFVETNDGSIGAVKRDDNAMCPGKVVDDSGDTIGWNTDKTEYVYHGLHYNKNDNKVTFIVKNLKAGCYLSVGIITKTPNEIDNPETNAVEKRRDFYNFASAKENELTVNSNLVHVFMGQEDLEQYEVQYEYTGSIPSGAPSVPNTVSYAENTDVKVASDPDVTGYTFSGWETSDVTINNHSFLMPNKKVVLRGSFTELPKFKVSYRIRSVSPQSYETPKDKNYYPETTVGVDALQDGDLIDNYEFKGWETDSVVVDEENEFIMPSKTVTFSGTFEEIKHTVSYRFYDGDLPEDADSLLPSPKEYSLGEIVKLDEPVEVQGYEFLGWYYEDNFEMPNEDIIIYGEWKRKNGEFKPDIKISIDNEKNFYAEGDTIKFKIEVKNNSDFSIKDVILEEETEEANFIEGDSYILETNHIATIPLIEPNQTIDIYSELKVTKEMKGNYTNSVKVIGALSDDYYELSKDEIKATAEYNVAKKININVPITGKSTVIIIAITSIISFGAIAYTVLVMKKKNKN